MNSITDGLYAFWKPKGITSNKFLNQIKKEYGVIKIGHAGTLDPLAEGVLVVGIGKGTKLITNIMGAEKEYIAEVKLGVNSETDDEEGVKTNIAVEKPPQESEINAKLITFLQEDMQLPPVYSAIKIKGKEAYKLARSGKIVEMKLRKSEIKKIELLSYNWPIVRFSVVTGPGVYIRAIARDLGEKLNTGGYLYSLKRTRVHSYTISDVMAPKGYN